MPTISSNNIRIYYETYGAGLPVVLLHAGSTNGGIWLHQTLPFARTHKVIVIDHRGHGRSDKPPSGYSIPEHSGDVIAVLDALDVERAVLVGNSIGGMIALQCNLDRPDRISGNVILSSGTGLGKGMTAEVRDAFKRDYLGSFRALMDGTVSDRTRRERPELLDTMKAHFLVSSNFPEHVFASAFQDPNGPFNWDISDRLAEIRAPTLVISGAEDQVTPPDAGEQLALGIPGAEFLLVPDVGHFCQLERPDEFNATLRQFLAKIPNEKQPKGRIQ